MDLNAILWLIPTLPLLGAVVNGFFGQRMSGPMVAAIGCVGPVIGFVLSTMALLSVGDGAAPAGVYFSWIETADVSVGFGLVVDSLTAVMLMVITGVGSLIHLYSYGYMSDDPAIGRFFSYLNLFMFSMLLLVMGDNLLLMFVGWEGVGLCSYLLIGFWYDSLENADAGRKAFVANRVGDLAFLVGMFALFSLAGTLDFAGLETALGHVGLDTQVTGGPLAGWTVGGVLQLAALCLFVGATGKSAQIPLYTWLPDAMAGPTPVSALIHAATMVTAGIYLVARLDFMFVRLPELMAVMGLVAALTATFAGVIAITQNDIKKILAYSTMSQLGYMFAGVATTVFSAGLFHLVTHAFFKALLFLGAGAVIHALHGEQDIRKMGGLRRDMFWVSLLFLLGCLALAGVPLFAGFYSKDAILAGVHLAAITHGGMWATTWWLLVATAAITAFYTFRLLIVAFFGPPADPDRHPHATHWTMMVPLAVLAVASVVGGYVLAYPIKGFTASIWAHGWAYDLGKEALEHSYHIAEYYSVGAVIVGGGFAILLYGFARETVADFARGPGAQLHWLMTNKFFVDEAYDALFVNPIRKGSDRLWASVDRKVIDKGAVEGAARVAYRAGGWLRQYAVGSVNTSTAVITVGTMLVLAFLFASMVILG